ncbi:MAG TPA: 2Fe-2S iron-sulfur cluster binding domain-containing protein [Rhodospirillales bacterium]|nr:2Fe-2S iron-sulfur cluster binding domain-containing protein [Rhodospirillales bacterium]HIB22904.1 2Fe-2S iron-sulfur cluster binding domain-containing protein [Rhodospirillales bacterium]|tara:strand:- start:3621 stop:4826 length:1206 start_codon:yes stop_codon:yes gene_type:complete
MTHISLTINGTQRDIDVEPRRSLVDYLRDDERLTGTHVGCEHGVCGACTILIDGAPARSCITYAVACESAEIITLEGLEDDPVISELRTAFHEHHALQCGYCTPGMLISAYDIVTRLPYADENRMRLELSGNLCRCTGYVGIVSAINSVLEKHRAAPLTRAPICENLGPVGSHPPVQKSKSIKTHGRQTFPPRQQQPAAQTQKNDLSGEDWGAVDAQGVELLQSFEVRYPRTTVWRLFENLEEVAHCVPGALLTSTPVNGQAEGEVTIKLGPITSAFSGLVEIERDNENYSAIVRGVGRDPISASRARAIIAYQIHATEDEVSKVSVSVKFLLAGPLAQFSRSGLLRNVADHLTKQFAGNLVARLSGAHVADTADTLDAGKYVRSVLWGRFLSFIGRLIGK